MQVKTKSKKITPEDIEKVLHTHFLTLMSGFYEMQSLFMSSHYQIHQSLETSNILICFIRSAHLAIIRQREKNLDHDLSLSNFNNNLNNLKNLDLATHKIISIVKITGIPKETVRRKLKRLTQKEFISINNHKEYHWILTNKRKDNFMKIMRSDIDTMTKFTYSITKYLKLNLSQKMIGKEIERQFSFYFYHFLSCQLAWLKMWQNNIKDIDLLLISLQTLIPALQYLEKNKNIKDKDIDLENIYPVVGKINEKYKLSDAAVSAASVAEVTGIPRATCIRKLGKLVKSGLLRQDIKTKRYYVNHNQLSRTKTILAKENINFTIKTFSEFLSIVINAFIRSEDYFLAL